MKYTSDSVKRCRLLKL